jgi:hypothetical protein
VKHLNLLQEPSTKRKTQNSTAFNLYRSGEAAVSVQGNFDQTGRLCKKFQTRQDSTELLGVPEALSPHPAVSTRCTKEETIGEKE